MNEQATFSSIDINLLDYSPYQPRVTYNKFSLDELAESIRKHGIINPILVRKKGERYEIIAGERRVNAAKLVGLKKIPAIIKNVDDNDALELALIDNIQREGINPIEEATAYNEILKNKSLTEDELSKNLGKSKSFVSNKLALLSLPESIKEAVANWKIGERHARSLLNVKDDTKKEELLGRIIKEKLTVKELDTIIKKEEKGSDNMNNTNFFPNMEQPQTQTDQSASLNSMNMQSMPATPASQEPTIPPVTNPIPDFSVPTENNNGGMQMPSGEQPLFTAPAQANDTVANGMSSPTPTPSMPETPVIEGFTQEGPAPMPAVEEPIVNVTPIDSAPANEPVMSQGEPLYDIPITATPEPPAATDINKVKELLNSNGISYKSYSNETGHCIIIEL